MFQLIRRLPGGIYWIVVLAILGVGGWIVAPILLPILNVIVGYPTLPWIGAVVAVVAGWLGYRAQVLRIEPKASKKRKR